MKVLEVTKENFDALMQSGKPVLLDFYATWCGPCRMVAPIVHEIAEERADILVGKVNVDEAHELAERFGIMSIPTLVVFKDGKEYRRVTGARPKGAILSLFD